MHAILDLETGGFSKQKNGLCEVAVLIVNKNYEIIDHYTSLIKPYKRPDSDELVSYKDGAMEVNGINRELLDFAPEARTVSTVLEGLFRGNGIKTIVAHNANFDQAWIEYFLERFGTGFKFENTICTLELAREQNLPVENNKLSTLLEYFGIVNEEEHRAFGDAMATLRLWNELRA